MCAIHCFCTVWCQRGLLRPRKIFSLSGVLLLRFQFPRLQQLEWLLVLENMLSVAKVGSALVSATALSCFTAQGGSKFIEIHGQSSGSKSNELLKQFTVNDLLIYQPIVRVIGDRSMEQLLPAALCTHWSISRSQPWAKLTTPGPTGKIPG